MSVLYKRYCRLTIAEGKENTKAIDFSAFRVSFTISQSLKGEPRSANIRIYNVNSETVSRIRQEGQKVILEAGYESNHAIIFQGDLIQRYRTKAESGNDTCLIILASTADQAHSYAVVNASLPAGASPVDVHQAILSEYARYGVEKGYVPELAQTKLARGKVLFCPAKDAMTTFCRTHQLQYSYLDTGLACVPVKETCPGKPFLLNERTGLVGTPEMSIDGLKVTSLLRPEIRLDTTLEIENDSIFYDESYGSQKKEYNKKKTKQKQNDTFDVDGVYKVISLTHKGDTYGKAWYSEMNCVAANPSKTGSSATAKKEK